MVARREDSEIENLWHSVSYFASIPGASLYGLFSGMLAYLVLFWNYPYLLTSAFPYLFVPLNAVGFFALIYTKARANFLSPRWVVYGARRCQSEAGPRASPLSPARIWRRLQEHRIQMRSYLRLQLGSAAEIYLLGPLGGAERSMGTNRPEDINQLLVSITTYLLDEAVAGRAGAIGGYAKELGASVSDMPALRKVLHDYFSRVSAGYRFVAMHNRTYASTRFMDRYEKTVSVVTTAVGTAAGILTPFIVRLVFGA